MEAYKYDIAISYVSEDKAAAKELTESLSRYGYCVFFDQTESQLLVGRPLIEVLERVFSKLALHFVMLISKDYVRKPYTTLAHILPGVAELKFSVKLPCDEAERLLCEE